jgi:hypothetical protein
MILLRANSPFVMPGLDPGIHDLLFENKCIDGRVKPGHDVREMERGAP